MLRKKRSLKQRMSSTLFLVAVLAVLFLTSTLVLANMTPVGETVEEPFEATGSIEKPAFIRLLVDTFDPLHEKPVIPSDLKIHSSQGYYIVQFNGPIHGKWRITLEDLGAIIQGYIPDYAFIVKMNDEIKNKVERLPNVRWIGMYHPAYKIQCGLIEKVGEIELNVVVFKDRKENLLKVRDGLCALGGVTTYDGEDNRIIRVRIDASKIRNIAFIPEVEWIDEYKLPVPEMNNIRGYTGTNMCHLDGFNGSGIVGEVKDNGIDQTHPDFVGQIIGTDGAIYEGAHGTCTFGIVFSTGANNADAMGILPEGKGVFCDYESVSRSASINHLVNNWGGVFQSNSWSTGERNGEYASESQENDQAVFAFDVVMLYSAGNSQMGVGSQTITTDSAAKNVICVGALNHYNNIDWTDDMWVNNGPGMTPSQGPAADGRIKPDLSGPFDRIFTTDSTVFTWDTFQKGYDDSSDYYDDMGGTSGACPVAAGAVGLVYQMYKEDHFGNNPGGGMPHASTVKAILIADAYQYELFQANRYQQGWGGVDIGNVYSIGEDHFIINESSLLQTGGSVRYSIIPTGAGPLKISLVWTDMPASPGADPALVNDLNLKVTDPDGFVYWGNYGLLTSKWSSPGGSADSLNNVENVFIGGSPTPGIWTVEVIGENVPGGDQAFALVASNAVETLRVDITYPSSGNLVNNITTTTGTSTGDITQVEVNIDGGSWENATGTTEWSYDWNTTLFSDGEHTIHARGFNGTAYSNVESVVVTVDNTPPTTEIFIKDPKYREGQVNDIWNISFLTPLNLTADDGLGCGVNFTQYRIYNSTLSSEWINYIGDFNLSSGWSDGIYTIEFYTVDFLINVEPTNNYTIYLDNTPPHTLVEVGVPKYRNATSDHWNVTTTTHFTLSPFDEHTGIESTWYIIDGTFFEGLSFDLMGYPDGPHTITWGSRDNLGNNESGNLIIVNLDTSSPVIELIIEGQKYRANDYDYWNVTTATNFTLLPFDGYSGINFTWYTIDGVYFEGVNFTFEGYDDGPHVVTWGSEDNLGNNETELLIAVYVDSLPPTTNLDIDEPKYRSSADDIWNVTKTTAFTLFATDEYARVKTSWYSIDGVYFEGCEFNLVGLSDGFHIVTWGSIDNLGQNETENSIAVNLDTHPPTTEMVIGEPRYHDIVSDNWNVTTPTPFTLLPFDIYSGLNFTWYTIDDIYFKGTTFNLTGYSDGYHTIIWGSRDNLGNNGTGGIVTIYLNTISLTTTLEIEGKKYRTTNDEYWNVTGKTLFILRPTNIFTGINFTWYTIDGNYFERTFFKLSDYNEGAHIITWGSEDNLGLNETGNSMTVILDNTPPETSIDIGSPRYRADVEEYWAVNATTIYTLTSLDNHSGVSFTWYEIDGVYFAGSSFTLSGYADGIHTILWGSEDNLGNNITDKTILIRLDDTPPTTSIEINTPYHFSEGVTYVNSTANVNLFCDDGEGVGVATIWYSLNGGGSYKTYTSPFTLPLRTTSIIYGAEDFVGNNATPAFFKVIVDETDTDSDGIYDIIDNDDDGDGILDEYDAYPLDTDNDGVENVIDTDDDADGIIDEEDPFPFDTDNDAERNDVDEDDDADGIDDTIDPYRLDTDNDGKRNDIDIDDDDDGLRDIEEDMNQNGIVDMVETNPLNPDTDGDGYGDRVDAYPLDKNRWENEGKWINILLIIFVIATVVLILLFLLIRKQKER